MHISEGVLSAPVLISGAAGALVGLGIGLRKMQPADVPRTAMLSGAFFVASFIHVPVGPSSMHLLLSGLVGLVLGWAAFPAIFVGLLLQALLFQYGGLTTLGVNTLIMAVPALIVHLLFGRAVLHRNHSISAAAAFASGALAIVFGALLLSAALIGTGEAFITAAKISFIAHLPVMLIEGFITAFAVSFLLKAKPEMLGLAQH